MKKREWQVEGGGGGGHSEGVIRKVIRGDQGSRVGLDNALGLGDEK